jgi:hypothetical protein
MKDIIILQMEEITQNMNLEELLQLKDFDSFIKYVCQQNNLWDLKSIIAYKNENNNFISLNYCNKEINKKLLQICSKCNFSNFRSENLITTDQQFTTESNKNIPNYSLEQLAVIENLGIRSQNACKYFSLNTLRDIIYYYKKNGDFLKVRNCGRKSNDELINVCKKYEESFIDELITHIEDENKNPIVSKIDELTVKQKAVLNNIIYSKFNKLSVRSKNALSALLQDSITVRALHKEFFDVKKYEFKNIRNVGEFSGEEIEAFISEVKELIELVSLFEDNEILKEYYNSYLVKNYQVSQDVINKIGEEYDFNFGYPIFKTLYYLVEGNYLFDEKEKTVFFGLLNFFYDATPPFIKDFKSNLNLTRERFRQLRNKTLKKLPNIINGLFNLELNYENLNTYQLSPNDEFINISDDDVCEINQNENVNFNSQFIIYIFSILLKKTHDFIGNSENIFFNKSTNNKQGWNNFYLIRKDLTWIFDFNKFMQDVYIRLSSKIQDDYKFYFQSYLLNFQNENCLSNLDTISTICETLVFSEFELTIDIEENIVFKRNVKKQVIQYVYEVLKEKNEPMAIYDIYNTIELTYPGITKSAEALRGSCQRDPNLIFFGRSSTYGLKIWEDEQDIRGGTIRDISEEFLLTQKEPKHIDKITEYVNRYRDTTAKNIYANLKMEDNNRFVFFSGLLIGLKSKGYWDNKYTRVEDKQIIRKTWDESFQLLEKFTQKNNRLPFSSGDEYEERLYRFLNVQLNRAGKGKVEESKLKQLTQLCEKFDLKKGKRRNSKSTDESYIELREFLIKESRLPTATNEAKLYRFLYTQGKLYKSNSLSKEYQDKYLEVRNLIKEIL